MSDPVAKGRERRQGQWFWRRCMIITLTVFSMTSLTWLMWHGSQEGKLHQLLAEGHFWIIFGLASIYVAGATIQDIVSLVTAVKGGGVAVARSITTQATHTETTDVRTQDKRDPK